MSNLLDQDSRLSDALHRAERIARHRLSPRRDRWAEVARFDERVEQLEARHGELTNELNAMREQVPAAEAEYQAALAAWHTDGLRGPRPESPVPALEERMQQLQDDLEAINRLIEQELEAKSTYVHKHRRRLAEQAAQATAAARAAYEAAIDTLAQTRQELQAARRDEVWALLHPSETLQTEPPMVVLAGGLRARWQRAMPSVTQTFGLPELERLLREDADALAGALTRDQQAALQGVDARLVGTHWQGTKEGQRAEQEEKRLARERFRLREGYEMPEFGG